MEDNLLNVISWASTINTRVEFKVSGYRVLNIHLQKIELLVLYAVIFRGMGLNFGNDPFATVGEGGDTNEEKKEAVDEEGLKG